MRNVVSLYSRPELVKGLCETARHTDGMQVKDSGKSEGHFVMRWIQIESDELNIIWPEKEQTSKKVLDCKII